MICVIKSCSYLVYFPSCGKNVHANSITWTILIRSFHIIIRFKSGFSLGRSKAFILIILGSSDMDLILFRFIVLLHHPIRLQFMYRWMDNIFKKCLECFKLSRSNSKTYLYRPSAAGWHCYSGISTHFTPARPVSSKKFHNDFFTGPVLIILIIISI